MKTLIIGAGPLGSMYTYLLHKSGKDVTLLARGAHYDFIEKNGLSLINEFTGEKIVEKVKVIDRLHSKDEYDLVIVLMRKNNVLKLLPTLSQHKYPGHILFMGNNAAGFEEYLKYLPKEKILFGFPGGGGSRLDHVAHYIDSEKPGGARMPVTLGELDGKTRDRTTQIKELFESSQIISLEDVLQYGISTGRGRVFADLWDLEIFSVCDLCIDQRKARLNQMNLLQEVLAPVVCSCQ